MREISGCTRVTPIPSYTETSAGGNHRIWQGNEWHRTRDISGMKRTLLALIGRLATAGTRPSDPDEVRLYKATISLTAALISLAGLLWAGMYAALGLYRAAAFPFTYAVISILTFPLAILANRFDLFR